MVLDSPRRRRGRYRSCRGTRTPRHLQHRRRRARAGGRMAAVSCDAGRGQTAHAHSAVARSVGRRRGGRTVDDRGPRCIERKSETRIGLEAGLRKLAGRIPARYSGGVVIDEFTELRPLLFSIAYRMLSSVSEAEDVVQEGYLRYERALSDGVDIASPKAYLSAIV